LKINYSRQQLVALCQKAFVKQKDWEDRDSASAQIQLAQAYWLLKGGCKFRIRDNKEKDKEFITDNVTIWLDIYWRGFKNFETGGDLEERTFYIPTLKRLKIYPKGDWY
jgi:hypothetical protein